MEITRKGILEAARAIASDHILINNWSNFDKDQPFFFTKNKGLNYTHIRPNIYKEDANLETFKAWWKNLGIGQKSILIGLAKIKIGNNLIPKEINDGNMEKLKKAYKEWNVNYFGLVYGSSSGTRSTSCNLFVGETMFRAGLKNDDILNTGKYLSAAEIFYGRRAYKKIKVEEVDEGDVLVIKTQNGFHVEIITKIVEKPPYAKLKFHSVGGGRDSGEGQERNGKEIQRELWPNYNFRSVISPIPVLDQGFHLV